MRIAISGRVKDLLSRSDWRLFRDSSVLTSGMILARGIGFIVTMLLARVFEPSDFGVIQYAVSVAGIIAIGLQPFGQHVLSRYVGMFRDKPPQFREYLSNIWGAIGMLFLISLAIAIPLLFYTGKFNLGVVMIFFGTSIYYIYYGLARGFLASGRLAAVDVGNNIFQVILILWLLQYFSIKSTLLAMLILGLAPIISVFLLQHFWPLPNAFDRNLINRKATKNIMKFSMPILASHASYMLFASMPIFFLEYFTDTATVGIFSLATTMGIALSFLPNSLATLLMPKIAGTPDKRYRTLLAGILGLVLLANIILAILFFFFAPWLVGTLFGRDYLIFPQIFVIVAVLETFGGVHTILTSAYVGRGRAHEETKSRLVALEATALSCWILIPSYGAVGAVLAKMIGIICSLMVYVYIYLRDHFRMSYKDQKPS